jgi:hypothetical protein
MNTSTSNKIVSPSQELSLQTEVGTKTDANISYELNEVQKQINVSLEAGEQGVELKAGVTIKI